MIPNGKRMAAPGHRLWAVVVLSFAAILTPVHATVPGHDLTEVEWLAWPDYCQAAFLASEWARGSAFQGRRPAAWVAQMRRTHNEVIGIPGAHHLCIGMVYINRAKALPTGQQFDRLVARALAEIEYSYSRLHKTAPMYSTVTAYYGMAYHLAGQRGKALQMWNDGIATRPASKESYLAMAQALVAERKLQEALDVLLRYDANKEYPAADAEYFLAHTYFELGRYDDARRHADRAYELGYPFPGLKRRLERVGK